VCVQKCMAAARQDSTRSRELCLLPLLPQPPQTPYAPLFQASASARSLLLRLVRPAGLSQAHELTGHTSGGPGRAQPFNSNAMRQQRHRHSRVGALTCHDLIEQDACVDSRQEDRRTEAGWAAAGETGAWVGSTGDNKTP
jgi:hypothetical protein